MTGPTTAKNRMPRHDHWLVDGALDLYGRPDDATITLAAPAGSNRDITVQLHKGVPEGDDAVDVDAIWGVRLHVFADAAGAAWATTGGSTGIVDNGAGAVQAVVAKKVFEARCDATGLLELRWTDTASEVAFLGVELPSGKIVISGALTI